MKEIIEKLGFSATEAEILQEQTQSFVSCQEDLQQIRKDLRTIKFALILIAAMLGFLLVS